MLGCSPHPLRVRSKGWQVIPEHWNFAEWEASILGEGIEVYYHSIPRCILYATYMYIIVYIYIIICLSIYLLRVYIYFFFVARMSYMNMNFNQHRYLLKFKKDLLEGCFSQKFTPEIPGIKMAVKTTFSCCSFGGWWLQIGKGSKCEAEIFAICIIAIPTTVSMIAKQHLNLWWLDMFSGFLFCLLIQLFRELSWSPNYSPVSFRACFEVDILS